MQFLRNLKIRTKILAGFAILLVIMVVIGFSIPGDEADKGATVIEQITREIADSNVSAGEISDTSRNIEKSSDELRQLAAKLNAIIGRFKF